MIASDSNRLTLRRILVAVFWLALGCGSIRWGVALHSVELLIAGVACLGGGVGTILGHPFVGAAVSIGLLSLFSSVL